MSKIKISVDKLSSRTQHVRKMLLPVAQDGRVACELCLGVYAGGKVIAAHNGIGGNRYFSDPNNSVEWQFNTTVPQIVAQYYELWRPIERSRDFVLDRAYFTLVRISRSVPDAKQVLCVHCDPLDSSPPPLCDYKRGPHLHIVEAESPLPHCHFPLNYGHLDIVCSSLQSISKAIGDAIQIVQDEFLVKCLR